MGSGPLPPPSTHRASRQHGALARRLLWLLVCLAVGVLVGVLVSLVFGSPRGYLAVPLALALGWLFFADPTQCSAPPAPPRGPDPKRGPPR